MTPDEYAQYRATCGQHFRDEEDGAVPVVDITDTFPEYVPLPTEPDQVVAELIPNAPGKQRRRSAKLTST